MAPWIAFTLVASLFQTWRTALQQRLRAQLTVNAASFIRFIYALPFDFMLVGAWLLASGRPLPRGGVRFLLDCGAAGAFQIVGTSLLITSFSLRNFAVGSAYAKTEGLQTAIIGWLLLGETLRSTAWIGIFVGLLGVLLLSLAGQGLRLAGLLRAALQPAALCGLGTGFCFALTSVFVKRANEALHGDAPILQALFTLLITNLFQTLMQGSWMLWRERAALRAAISAWRRAVWVGAMSAVGSGCWFSAFALAPVGLVRSLGQMEMPLILLFSHFYLRERIRRSDAFGLVLVGCGVALVLVGARSLGS